MQRHHWNAGIAALSLAAFSLFPALQFASAQPGPAAPQGGRGGNQQPAIPVYTFKPKDISYHAPMKPVYHIADIIAAHKGQTDWEQPVVKDAWFFNQYISMGPGKKTPVSFQGDSPLGAYHQTIMLGKPSTRTPAGTTGVMDSAISLVPSGAGGGGD